MPVMLLSVLNTMLGNGIDQDEMVAFSIISRHRKVFCHVVNEFSFFHFIFSPFIYFFINPFCSAQKQSSIVTLKDLLGKQRDAFFPLNYWITVARNSFSPSCLG